MVQKFALFIVALISMMPAISQQAVKLTDNGESVILSNQYIKATIVKRTATITSLFYNDIQMMGREHAHWNIVGGDDDDNVVKHFPTNPDYAVTINPKSNNGERVEISIRYNYRGDTSTIPFDIELKYSLGCNDKGIYLSGLWKHRKGYPAFELGQARMLFVLNPSVFDFYTVDKNRRQRMASAEDVKNGKKLNVKEANLLTTGVRKGMVEHKYDYSAMLAQTPTWGWTSTKKHVGVWMINPSFEYINGGPTQVGNTGHVETILMNHWHDGHYGGRPLQFEKDEEWEKFVGPFFLYFNSGKTHDEMWSDAIVESRRQCTLWPYSWEESPSYTPKLQRSSVSGKIEVTDSYMPNVKFSNMWVGLAFDGDEGKNGMAVNWQYQGKHYQHWVRADSLGNFTISNIHAGTYTLYAFADGILGEFKKTDIVIAPSSSSNLGKLIYTPLRYGKQLWEIGIPDRSAAEFRYGDHYWQWGLYLMYPREFPNDVNFTIGKSNWKNDWNYCQPSVIDSLTYKTIRGTTWSIDFEMPTAVSGKATLRLAFCGARRDETVLIAVNGTSVGKAGPIPGMGVMHRDGIRGKQAEYAIPFDAALLKPGTNTITLTLPPRNWTFGVLYDYLRLELDEKNSDIIP
jgi:rhamnogalacturonan endolyase